MKQKKLKVVLLCVSFLLIILSGCGSKTVESTPADDDNTVVPAAEDNVYITLYLSNEINDSEKDSHEADAEVSQNMTTTMVASIAKEDLSVDTIISEYNQMVVQSIYGKNFVVNEIKVSEQNAWVDFDSDSVEALGIEEGNEGQLFYNLARSIDENMGDIDEIYFTMDGGQDFRVGHLWFEANRPFYSGILPIESEDQPSGNIGPE